LAIELLRWNSFRQLSNWRDGVTMDFIVAVFLERRASDST